MDSFDLVRKIVGGLAKPWHPGYAVFFVTSRCNCGCSMCFNKENVRGGSKNAELPISAVQKIAQSMMPLPQLLLSGGEPFLRRDLDDIVRVFYEYAGTRQISIPTNATLPDNISLAVQRMLEKCPNVYLNINISLDGLGSDHDRSRAFSGCFERIHETYRQLANLRRKHPRLTINFLTVIKRDNAAKIREIVDYVRCNFNANYHMFGTVRGNVDAVEKSFDIDQADRYVESLYREQENFSKLPVFSRFAPAVARVVRSILAEASKSNKRNFFCLAGRKMVVITPEGKLMPCEPLWLETEARTGRKDPDQFMLADLCESDYSVRAALASPRACKIKSFIATGKCSCAYGCAVLNSVVYCPLMYPQILRELLRFPPSAS